jgi:hypothetical protein
VRSPADTACADARASAGADAARAALAARATLLPNERAVLDTERGTATRDFVDSMWMGLE